MKRDLISINNLSPKEIETIFSLTAKVKKNKKKYASALKGKSVALVFQKPSNRTRVSFEVGTFQLGGNCLYLGPDQIHLGKRETTADVAMTLSRYVDFIVARTFSHQDIFDLAKYATIPIINGLSDLSHPCQALADIFTVREKFGKKKGITIAYIGDGNNVCHSLMLCALKTGINMSVATPVNYEPQEKVVKNAQGLAKANGLTFKLTNSPQEGIAQANIIYTDVWTSMGQEAETQKRLQDFKGFQINSDLVKLAAKDFVFMHCLPAHRDEEVTSDVIDGSHSIVFDQAENRMHVQKAILLFLSGDKK